MTVCNSSEQAFEQPHLRGIPKVHRNPRTLDRVGEVPSTSDLCGPMSSALSGNARRGLSQAFTCASHGDHPCRQRSQPCIAAVGFERNYGLCIHWDAVEATEHFTNRAGHRNETSNLVWVPVAVSFIPRTRTHRFEWGAHTNALSRGGGTVAAESGAPREFD